MRLNKNLQALRKQGLAGTLNHKIKLEQKTVVQNSFGEELETWGLIAEVWANVRMLNGKEFMTGNAEVARTTVSFRIRHRTDLHQLSRVIYKNTLYDVKAVLLDRRNEYVDLACEAIGQIEQEEMQILYNGKIKYNAQHKYGV